MLYVLGMLSICGIFFGIYYLSLTDKEGNFFLKKDTDVKTACAVVNGDILVHAALYYTVKKEDGGYDFNSYFEYVKPWIEGADLAIGDFEGAINDCYQIGGYPN